MANPQLTAWVSGEPALGLARPGADFFSPRTGRGNGLAENPPAERRLATWLATAALHTVRGYHPAPPEPRFPCFPSAGHEYPRSHHANRRAATGL